MNTVTRQTYNVLTGSSPSKATDLFKTFTSLTPKVIYVWITSIQIQTTIINFIHLSSVESKIDGPMNTINIREAVKLWLENNCFLFIKSSVICGFTNSIQSSNVDVCAVGYFIEHSKNWTRRFKSWGPFGLADIVNCLSQKVDTYKHIHWQIYQAIWTALQSR